jgi:DNA-binding NtrC family response regulator
MERGIRFAIACPWRRFMAREHFATESGTTRTEKVRVFLGEDDNDMRDLIASVLRRDGLDVVAAANGLELLRQIQVHGQAAGRQDLVVTDVRMPGASGLDVLAWVQQVRPRLPVIIVTGFSDANLRARARSLGAVAVIDKPFNMATLQTTIQQVSGMASGKPANSNSIS